MNEEDLRKQAEAGKLEDVIRNLSPQQAAQFRHLMSHPEEAQQLMNTPQAQALLRKFLNRQ